MDRVRFGRALGYGARHAAKTLVAAAEAAAAPSPSAPKSPTAGPSAPREPQVIPPERTARVAEVAAAARQGVAGARAASGGMIAPVRRFSMVLWLEVTGAFFGILAFSFGAATWRFRQGFLAGADLPLRHRVWTFAALLLVFAYFSVSSFFRAGQRGRQ